jgi:PAS domain S-box-containing protein
MFDAKMIASEKMGSSRFTRRRRSDPAVRLASEEARRRRAETALSESEARLRSILESAPNIILWTDCEGRIVFINRRPEPSRASETAEDAIGRYVWDFASGEDREKVRGCVARVRETKTLDAYETVVHKPGSPSHGRRFSVHVGPICFGDTVGGLTFVAWDVTDQHELEARVMLSDRIASTASLAAGMAHEINNPLAYLLVNLRWIARELAARGTEDKMSTWVAAALDGAERIREVVHDLNTFSQVDTERLVLIDVRPMLESAIHMTESEVRERARIVRNFEDVPAVHATDSRLGQVFLNLIVNAWQAIPAEC